MSEQKKSPGIFSRIIGWFKDQAEWVVENVGDEEIAKEIREDLGLNPDTPLPKTEMAKLPGFAKDLDPEKESFAETAAEIGDAVTALVAVAGAAKNDQLSAWDTMFYLASFTANESIRLRSPFFYWAGQLSLILRDDPEELGRLDPGLLVGLLRGEGPPPGGAERFHQRLFASLPVIMEILPRLLGKAGLHLDKAGIDVDTFYGWDPAPDSPTPEADLVSMRALTLLLSVPSAPAARLAITILSVPRPHGGPGVFLSFGGSLSFDATLEGTRYRLTTGGSGAFDLFIPLGGGARALEAGGDPEAFIRFDATRSDPGVPAFRVGEAGHTRLDVGAVALGVELAAKSGGLSVTFSDCAFVVKMGEGDGFLKNLSDKEIALRFGFGIVFDSDNGLRLAGGSGAALTLPVANSVIGAFTIHHVDLRLGAGKRPDDFAIELSAAMTISLGPFRATLDRIGLKAEGGFREGNLGIMDLDLGFRAPNGIGLVLETKHIKGGGYLFIDRERGEYAGVLEIRIGPVNVKAIGLLQTRTADRDDWSLLLFLFGQFSPVPIGPGLNWSGVGGMIGLRRTTDVEKLQAAVRIGALDDIMFPKDPVADAPRIINGLRTFFPYAAGSLIVGPFLELGFLKPQIVILRVGVLFQCDQVTPGAADRDLTRVLVLGQVLVAVPPKIAKPIVKIICDVFGVIDLQAKSVLFSARLRDSKVMTFTLTGMIVLRHDYGEKTLFVLAAGGFHPDFKDVPPGLPAPIDRLGISPIKIKGFKLEVTAYFAITPNTKQFGIGGKIKGELGPLSLEAGLTIDALILDEPYPHFIVTVKFVARIKYKGHSLAGVKVDCRVEGPGYWRVSGKVVFEILWWEIDIPFDKDCGEKPQVISPAINVGGLLQAALASEAAWETPLPAGGEAFVTLARSAASGSSAHPLAGLNVVQNVAPLGVTIERFGTARVTGANRFDVTALRVGPVTHTAPPTVNRPFGRGQFFDLTDEQRLTLPSFEPFAAGVTAATPDFTFGAPVVADLKYETAYLEMQPDAPRGRVTRATLLATGLPASAVGWQSKSGAAARSAMRERARAPQDRPLAVSIEPVALVAVDRQTLAPSATVVLTGQPASSPTAAAQAIRTAGAAVTIVEVFEAA